MSKSLDTFLKTINRCEGLLAIYDKIHSNESFEGLNKADVLRSVIVLSVSGMDSYFTARFTERLIPFIKKKGATKDLIIMLEKAGLDTHQALEMLSMDRPYRRIRTLVDQYLSNKTTQQFRVIDDLFLVYGIKNLTENAQRSIKRKSLKNSINKIVKRRHRIAHSGDYNQHNRLNKIEYKSVKRQIEEIKIFVIACDHLLD